MTTTTARSSIKLKADLLFSRLLTNGNYDPAVLISNATEFGIQPQGQVDSIQGTELGNYQQTLDSIAAAGDLAINISANRFNGRNLALALMGDEVAQAAASITDNTGYVLSVQDGFASLPYHNVTAVTVTGGALTTDYTLNGDDGRILIVGGGAFDSATTLTITSITYDEIVGSEISIGTNTIIKGRLWVKGVNAANNKRVWIHLRQVTLQPNAPLNVLADQTNRSTVTYNGTAETPQGETNPGEFRIAA